MKKFLIYSLCLVLYACTPTPKPEKNERVFVLCTTNIIGDAFKQILPDSLFHVKTLMGAGTDPHLYKPTPQNLADMKKAHIIIANGLHLEGKMTGILEKLSVQKKVLFIADGVATEGLIEVDEGIMDPHFWFDINLWSQGIRYACEDIKIEHPKSTDFINKNLSQWLKKGQSLDLDLEHRFYAVSPEKRQMLTAHDAFAYFARRYDIKLKAIQGISTSSEYGTKDILDLANYVVENKITTAFFESSVPKKSVETLKKACRDKNHQLQLSGPLFSDALNSPDQIGGNYWSMLEHNSQLILEGMQ